MESIPRITPALLAFALGCSAHSGTVTTIGDSDSGTARPDARGPRPDVPPTEDTGTAEEKSDVPTVAPTDLGSPQSFCQRVAPVAPNTGAPRANVFVARTQALRAFPGAEGFGALATGGRGGRVVFVTNTNAEGAGSLQAAMEASGPRYVLFRVGGVIRARIHLRRGDVTIAGQTAPGGVTVQGFHTTEQPFCDQSCPASTRNVENVILRHLRSRPTTMMDDALRLRYVRNVIVDHVSVGNAEDEAMEISYSNTITVQNTLLAETLGAHVQYGGMLINYSNPAANYALDRLSIHHNNWNRLGGRYPELSRESSAAAGSIMELELSNNLLWDQRFYIDLNPSTQSGNENGPAVHYHLNWVGNLSWTRSAYPYGAIFLRDRTGRSGAFFSDDHMHTYPSRSDWQLNHCCADFPSMAPSASRPSWGRTERYPFPPITYTPSSSLREYMVANVGAFPRDPMDTRLMGAVARETIDPTANDRNPANDALRTVAEPGTYPADSDLDGMPDAWECSHELDPTRQDHNGTQLSMAMTGVEGYTNLECYLNELAELRVRFDR